MPRLFKFGVNIGRQSQDSDDSRFESVDVRHRLMPLTLCATVRDELLAKSNLSPEDLLERLLEKSGSEGGHPALSGKGENPAPQEEQNLYRTILSEAAQLIVDVASQYPKYSDAVFAELLSGQDEHLKRFDQILDEPDRIRKGRKGDGSEFDAFEEKYRRAVIRRLDELQLFGVDLAATTKRYKLSTAYVSLLVERQRELHAASQPTERNQDEQHEVEDATDSLKVEDALAQTTRLFVRGGAGSGKTTLLQWVAVMSAARNLKDELEKWNDYVPFFIRLREFAHRSLPSPDDFAGLISTSLDSAPSGWERSRLRSGKAIVLVDGLDELPTDRIDEVRKWLDDLTDAADGFPDARFVLSSRPHAADERWLETVGFLDAELQDMDSADISSFISHWHDAAREGLTDAEKIGELDNLGKALTERLSKSASIRKLATTPLLCAVICALHRDRMQNIPDDRIELYEACVEMFLRRDHERRIELPDYPRLSSRQIKALLSDLAYWYIRNDISLTDAIHVDERLQKKLETLKDPPKDATGTTVRQGFVARSGILREPTTNTIDFPHRTFQEFLAARQIVDDRDFGILVKNADDQNWRETIILAAGLASRPDAEELIGDLISRYRGESQPTILFVAVSCLETMVEFPDSIKERVEAELKSIVPPKSITEAKEISKAGDLVVRYLGRSAEPTKAKQAAACVRALSLINGEEAWHGIQTWIEDPRSAVREEISRAFNSRCVGEMEKGFVKFPLKPSFKLLIFQIVRTHGFGMKWRMYRNHDHSEVLDIYGIARYVDEFKPEFVVWAVVDPHPDEVALMDGLATYKRLDRYEWRRIDTEE